MLNNDESAYLGRWLEVLGARWACMIEAYFDESTSEGRRWTCVAGYVFSVEKAVEFREIHRAEVQPLLPPEAEGVFHAKDCIGRHEEYFKRMPREKREEIVDRLISTILRTASYGVVVGIQMSTYSSTVRQNSLIPRVVKGSYVLCLLRCMEYISEWLERQGSSDWVSYTFESNEHARKATAILSRVKANRRLEERYRLAGYGFVSKKCAPPLQAADLLSWEWQRAQETALREEYKTREWRNTIPLLSKIPYQERILSAGDVSVRAIGNVANKLVLRKTLKSRGKRELNLH